MVYATRLLSTTSLPVPRSTSTMMTRRYKRTMATAVSKGVTSGASASRWSLWQLYQRNLDRRPLLTKAVMASFIFFASDSATQAYLPAPSNLVPSEVPGGDAVWRFDASRALSGAGFGVVATSWLHYWWGFLEAWAARALPSQRYRLANTLTKVAVDQLVGAPLYIYSYYVLTNFLQDVQEQKVPIVQSWWTNNEKAADMLWPTMLQHWKLWPLVHSFNFYYAPLHHRVLVQNCVLVGWSGYLSHLNHTNTKLMTPDEEIKVTIVRRETELRLKAQKTQGEPQKA